MTSLLMANVPTAVSRKRSVAGNDVVGLTMRTYCTRSATYFAHHTQHTHVLLRNDPKTV